ncbi:MAG: radical SAM protein [Rivularia sp. (in: cyanobacteria)]
MEILDHSQYVELTMHFRCNLKCEHCMIEDTMDWLEPQSIKEFKDILTYNNQHRRWKGIILTGSEVTLRRDLPELVRLARNQGFERVRIQTNAIRLADKSYCQELITAGIRGKYSEAVTRGKIG